MLLYDLPDRKTNPGMRYPQWVQLKSVPSVFGWDMSDYYMRRACGTCIYVRFEEDFPNGLFLGISIRRFVRIISMALLQCSQTTQISHYLSPNCKRLKHIEFMWVHTIHARVAVPASTSQDNIGCPHGQRSSDPLRRRQRQRRRRRTSSVLRRAVRMMMTRYAAGTRTYSNTHTGPRTRNARTHARTTATAEQFD